MALNDRSKRLTMTGATLLAAALFTGAAEARVISYAPVTNQQAIPAVQSRTNRHYLLVEQESAFSFGGGPAVLPCGGCFQVDPVGRLVLYDSRGLEDPKVVFPKDGTVARLSAVAYWEDGAGEKRAFFGTDAPLAPGDNPDRIFRYVLLDPARGTLTRLDAVPGALRIPNPVGSFFGTGAVEDRGGPLVRGRRSQILPTPNGFAFLAVTSEVPAGSTPFYQPPTLYLVSPSGSVRTVAQFPPPVLGALPMRLAGTDAAGTRFLVAGARGAPLMPGLSIYGLATVDLDGRITQLSQWNASPLYHPLRADGWIAPDGSVYANLDFPAVDGVSWAPFTTYRAVGYFRGGTATVLASQPDAEYATGTLFAVPTHDSSGAWLLARAPGKPAVLSRHAFASGLVEAWRDVTSPEVEALHAASSGERLLVQVHRPRPQADQRIFRDPALAIWEIGTPAPRSYDELFLNEVTGKGFVQLDVDAVAQGGTFVFDSALADLSFVAGGPSGGPGAGGADVGQEWGVVRASLRQRLVVPAVARSGGFGGVFWKSDLLVRNPSSEPLDVALRFVPQDGGTPVEKSVPLPALSIRVFEDVLASVFGVASGAGPVFLTPPVGSAIEATSRTYSRTGAPGAAPVPETGMGVPAFDVFASSSPRFPVSFAAAVPGEGYRTNVLATDLSGRSTQVSLRLFPDDGSAPARELSFVTPTSGQRQLNGLAGLFGVSPAEAGAVLFQPTSGEALASLITIDDLSNDPTYFAPDLPSPTVRTLPALVHVDGANGARFRSDLFLFNPAETVRFVTLAAKRWDVLENEKIVTLALLPHESKVIRDALPTLFGRTGVARLRYQSSGDGTQTSTDGVRATSRTYNLRPEGGTVGLVMPPLNAFQSAGPGESLEILGPIGDASFRTNLALVDLTAFADGGTVNVRVEVIDDAGRLVDAFTVPVPVAGGIQLDDVFRNRGLGVGPKAAVLRVSPAGGLVGAYATLVNNGTNDSVYYPAALAAR